MELVEWLRERAKSFYNPMQSKLLEAAAEIERLRNKVQWLEMCENTVIKQDNEIERLREALRVIRDELGDTPRDSMRAYEISDAALKGQG